MNLKTLLFCALFLVIGIVIGFLFNEKDFGSRVSAILPKDPIHETRAGGYKYISPLLECDYNQASIHDEFGPLKNSLSDYINSLQSKKVITDAAVYFRDLNNGPNFGINSSDDFSPASLLKLPVMMAYFKKSEDDPSILTKKVKYEKQPELISQNFVEKGLKLGEEYTIEDLINQMIKYSDNNSLIILQKNIDEKEIDKITVDLGVETATETTPDNFMSVKGYASLLRILYNASYLSKKNSEKALDVLTQTDFSRGIVAGVPSSIPVAHKYGERGLAEGQQLHDCGIVYYPQHPYLICIMTRGSSFKDLATTISDISHKVYTYVNEATK